MVKKLRYNLTFFKLVILLMLCSIAKAQTTPISYSASPSFSNVVSGQSFTFSDISTCQTSVTLDVSNYLWTLGNFSACMLNYRFKILVNNVEIGSNYCSATLDLSSYIPVNSVQIVPYHSGAGNGNGSAKMDVVLTVNSPTASMPPLATTSDVFYCYSATASPLSPTLAGSGASFKWYTAATGGLPSTTAPTPNTNISNTRSYWVSQVTASGCEGERKEIQVTVNPAIVTWVGNQVNVLCHGNTTGSATVNVTGGTGTYTYLWAPTGGTAATATGLAAGNYTVTVTDANLCFKTQSFTITEPSVLTASAGPQVNVLCRGNATGTAKVNVTGGTGTYTYNWNTTPVQITATATGLAEGTYTVTVTDSNLCTTTQAFTITQPTAALVATAGTQVNVLCNGNATGSATVNVTGGTGVYSYSWNTTPVQTTATATGLTAGTHTVTVTDANLCTTTQAFTITQPSALTATAGTQVNVLCNGNATGTATVNVTGGTGTYTYSWNTTPVQTIATATGLTAGTHTVTVTDANLCTTTQAFTITEPSVLTASAGTQVDVLCHGNTTGEATVNVTGGTGAYTYSWDTTPVQTTATATGLAEGTYTVTVTDANLCTTMQGFTITEPLSALTATAGTQVDVLCFGNATGEATVNATGGTGVYTYSWDTTPVQTTATATGLTAGTHTVTVTDGNLCTTTQAFTITEPSALATAGTQVDVFCHGNATGSATVNVTGGTGIYTYSWDTTPVQTSATATGLAAGTHTVTVTDANLCTTTQGFTITEPSALTATAGAQVNVLCHGNATGQATVNVTGGTAIYTYSWDTTPVQITPTITGLTAGTYTVTVTDANLCTATQSFIITEPSVLTASAGTQLNVLCFGNATGTATVNATGGAGAYAYSWNTSPVQTTATATGLTAGNYTVTVTDANSCTVTQAFTITEPAAAMTLTPNTTQTDVLCNGQATGAATVAVTGGTGAFTYLWSNGGTTNTITGLTAGTYTVDVTDANLCILSNSFTITEPSALTATAGTQVDVLCFGNATGTATVNVTGGTGAYSYSWNTTPVQTTATATGLTAGTHTVTVTDANLCTTTQAFTITEPSLLVATAGPQNNVLCYGNATGTAYINANGGTGPYSYSWDTTPVQTTALATGLIAGTYTATVTDGNGCTATQSFTITQPTATLVATAGTQVDVLCFGNATGAATVNVTGGTGAYIYNWDTTPVQIAAMATGLIAGTYTVTVTDANLCTTTQSFTITEPLQPLALTPNTTQTDVLCNGQATGAATVAVNGGTAPYSYLWNNGQTTNTITGLTAGTYTVTVTDANGCVVSNSFTITQPSALVATAGPQTNVLCFGNATGTATVNVAGGTGAYVYNWSPSGGTAATATGLASGTYTVTVTDANLCQTTQSFTITQPLQPLSTTPNTSQTNVSCFAGANGTATMALNGGTAPYSYLWNNGQTTAIAIGLIAGTYSVIATDANGCTLSQSFTITEPTAFVATAGPQTNITCFGAANGSATVNATGGTGAYTYSWNTTPVQTTPTANGLAPGNYTVTVTDANLCTATQAFTITQPQLLTATVNNFANILCYGAATGSAGVSVSGGTAPYTYLWNTGQTTDTATGLTAGSYTAVVTDAHGCQANASITLTQPATQLVATAGAQTNLLCNGNNNGSATVNVTGGTGAYSYSWNTTPVQTTATATGLAAGTYIVTVYDANQCQTTRSFTITQPAAVSGYFTVVNSDCHATGSATVHAIGGIGSYTYLWSNGNTTPNLQNALPGTYTVTITDANGCSNVLTTTINGTAPIIVTSAPQSVTLNGGESVTFTVEAQNATYYQWQVSTNGGVSFANLNAGGSLPTYYGVATPTLTVANAYSFIDGYQFRVMLMQQSGCYIFTDIATLEVGPVVVGIDDIKHVEMNIYPNPASTEVFVKIPDFGLYSDVKVAMYDLNGRIVRREQLITSDIYSIDVTGLESGTYIISITSDAGRTDKKVIISK